MSKAKELISHIGINADWVSVRFVNEKNTQRLFRDAKPETNEFHETKGAMIEVMVDGYIGYSSTLDLSKSGINTASEKAASLAKQMKDFGLQKFSANERPPSKGKYVSPKKKAFSELSTKDLSDFQIACCEKLKVSSEIATTHSSIYQTDQFIDYASTNGADFQQELNLLSTDLIAIAQRGSETHRRSDFGWNGKSYQGGAELLDFEEYFARCKIIGNETLELLYAENCPTETTNLVLYPDQMMLQIHESIGHPLELDRILGDERNYAGSSFVKLEDFGKLQYGSKIMNATFDPTVSGEYASYSFDDGGNPAKKTYLVKDGVLVGGLGGLESGKRTGLGSVANYRSSGWNRAPIDRMANLNIEPGDSSFEEMIEEVKNGVIMYSNTSWSIDDYRRKFQFGCEYAKKIENGKITKTLKNPNYRGETLSFWRNLTHVGNSSTWKSFGTPFCGKGEPNQVIRVGHASPICAFKNIEIFGGLK
jgi:predicted Zn-dependent protease